MRSDDPSHSPEDAFQSWLGRQATIDRLKLDAEEAAYVPPRPGLSPDARRSLLRACGTAALLVLAAFLTIWFALAER